jgi:hypothetical protein
MIEPKAGEPLRKREQRQRIDAETCIFTPLLVFLQELMGMAAPTTDIKTSQLKI